MSAGLWMIVGGLMFGYTGNDGYLANVVDHWCHREGGRSRSDEWIMTINDNGCLLEVKEHLCILCVIQVMASQ